VCKISAVFHIFVSSVEPKELLLRCVEIFASGGSIRNIVGNGRLLLTILTPAAYQSDGPAHTLPRYVSDKEVHRSRARPVDRYIQREQVLSCRPA